MRIVPDGFGSGDKLEEGKWYQTQRGSVVKVTKIVIDKTHAAALGYAHCSDGTFRLVGNQHVGATSWSDAVTISCFIRECHEDGSSLFTYEQQQLNLFE